MNDSVFSKKGTYLSLVIPPCANTADYEVCIDGVCAVLDKHLPNNYELIVSGDGTSFTEPHYITISPNEDGSYSFSKGWELASGEILGVIDGNLEKGPSDLVRVLEELHNGADMAITNQYLDDDGEIGCFAIRRDRLTEKNFSDSGYRILIESLGPDRLKEIQQFRSGLGLPHINKASSRWQHYLAGIQSLFGTNVS